MRAVAAFFFLASWGAPPCEALKVGGGYRFGASADGSDRNHTEQPVLRSGDSVFLWGPAGAYLSIEGYDVSAHHRDSRGRAGLFILKKEGGFVSSGDTVYLHSPDGMFLDVEDESVQARWADPGEYQTLTIHGRGEGPIRNGDMVAFTAHNDLALCVTNKTLKASTLGDMSSFKVDRPAYGALHDVVGKDGVLMIAPERADGALGFHSERSLDKLSRAGVYPATFWATPALKANPIQLQLSCPLEENPGTQSWCAEMGRKGQTGCKSVFEQAITDSHRRALLAASKRPETAPEWTAIIEDGVVPVQPESFNRAFREAWADVPQETRLVRLSWCTFENDIGEVKDTAMSEHSGIRLVRERWWTDASGAEHYYTGGCTTGYLVHKSFIKEMLQIFPCCCGFDCCLERQLLYAPAVSEASDRFGRWRGFQIMVDMDHAQARAFSQGLGELNQSGILVQDSRDP